MALTIPQPTWCWEDRPAGLFVCTMQVGPSGRSPSHAADPPSIVLRAGQPPAAAVPPRRWPVVRRRPHRRHHRGSVGRGRRVAGPHLLPTGHPLGLPRAGAQRGPLVPRRRRPPDRPPSRPRAEAVLLPDRGVLPGPQASARGVLLRRGLLRRACPGRPVRSAAGCGRDGGCTSSTARRSRCRTRPRTRRAYPQVYNQGPGLGFPIARIGCSYLTGVRCGREPRVSADTPARDKAKSVCSAGCGTCSPPATSSWPTV